MTRINPVIKQPIYSAMSKSAIIANLKMEIAELKNKMDMGLIPFEEGQLKVLTLESKLSALESGMSVDGVNFPPPPTLDLNLVPQSDVAFGSSENINNFEDRHNLFLAQQASYNKAFHNL